MLFENLSKDYKMNCYKIIGLTKIRKYNQLKENYEFDDKENNYQPKICFVNYVILDNKR